MSETSSLSKISETTETENLSISKDKVSPSLFDTKHITAAAEKTFEKEFDVKDY